MTIENSQERNGSKVAEADSEQLDTTQDNKAVNNLKLMKEFNEILGTHIERLLDTRFGIEELELNIFSISCIVLLATRETEIETFPASPPSRYTKLKLIEELAEMSIEPECEIENVIEDMTRKSYLKITDERIFCDKPMGSMALLFDRIFPRMPGLNLVAYLGQMIDEVTAGRKPLAEASKQFYQMLEIQGVSINEQGAPKLPQKKFSHLRLGDDSSSAKKARRPRIIPGKPANIFSQLKTGTVIKTPATVKADIPSPIEEEIKGISDTLNAGTAISNDPAEAIDSSEIADTAATAEVREESTVTENIAEQKDQQEKISDSFAPADDREIEDRVLEFEEQLGLKCPFCGTGGIKTNETAKGKAYYHCSNDDCNFISWGKPYYFECPECGSNFLIEITDSSGRSFLKCPRATCSHWQKFPWDESDQFPEYSGFDDVSADMIKKPKRKVRKKRRVVRRRKSV